MTWRHADKERFVQHVAGLHAAHLPHGSIGIRGVRTKIDGEL